MPLQEVSSIRDVKQRLHQLYGLPPRFRQRLILGGANLDDAASLDSPLDLELVVLSFSSPSDTEADDLPTAVRHGSVEQVGCLAHDRAIRGVLVSCQGQHAASNNKGSRPQEGLQ